VDMRFSMWNTRSPYGAGSPMTVVKGISKYKLVRVQEVKCYSGGTKPAGEYTFSYGFP
jgi:hypothetical protein